MRSQATFDIIEREGSPPRNRVRRWHGTNEPADETLKPVRKPAHDERLLVSSRWTHPDVIRLMPPLMGTGTG